MTDDAFKALVIDDSPTDSQTLAYLLSKRLQIQAEIANDGIEGLDQLSSRRFDIVFLDLQMPLLSGVDVLREIRAAPSTAALPVVVISSNTDAATVRSLVQLGIFDFVVKPFNAELIVKRFSEKFAPLRARPEVPGAITLPADLTVRDASKVALLIADDDAKFRHFFVSMLGREYQVLEASNGAQALAIALKYLPEFVCASTQLGVFNRDRLADKLRATPSLRGVKIIAIDAEGAGSALDRKRYDGQVRRTFAQAPFKAALEALLAGNLPEAAKFNGESALYTALVSATEQAFGMMMSTEIAVLEPSAQIALGQAATYGFINMFSYSESQGLTVNFSCAQSSIIAMATRMLQMNEAEAAQNLEMAQSTLAETLNIVGGRIKQTLEEQGRRFLLGLPKVEESDRSAGAAGRSDACKANFAAGENIRFSLEVWTRPLSVSKVDCAGLASGATLAAPIDISSGARWEAGTILTADTIGELQAMGAKEVAIFEPL
jgi:CheY-like chemotaxis protein